MVEETTKAEGATVKEETPETEEVTQPTVEELQKQNEVLKTQLGASQTEALQAKQTASKQANRAGKQEDLVNRMAGIEKVNTTLVDMMAEVIDRSGGEYEEKQARPSVKYTEALKQSQEAKPAQVSTETPEELVEADRLIRSVGLDWEDSPELHKAYVKYGKGDAPGMLEETKKVVEAKKAEIAKSKQDFDTIVGEKVKAKLTELKVDFGGLEGQGANSSDAVFLKNYGENKTDDHKRAKELLDKL